MSREFSSTIIDNQEMGGGTGGSGGPHFDLKRMLILRSPMIIAVAILLSIPTVIMAWVMTPTTYVANAQIRFLSVTPRVLDSSRGGQNLSYDKFVATEIAMITGNIILQRVLDEPHIQALPSLVQVDDRLEFLKSQIRARVQGNSELVNISFELEDREEARIILNEVISKYLEYASAAEQDSGGERLRTLNRTRDMEQNELDLKLRRIRELQSQISAIQGNTGLQLRSEADIYREYLLNAEATVSNLQNQVSDYESQIARVQQLQEAHRRNPDQQVFDFGVESSVNADGALISFRSQLATQEAQLRLMEQRQRDTSRMLVSKRQELESLQEHLRDKTREVRGDVLNTVLSKLELNVITARNNLEEAQDQVEKHRAALDEHSSEYNQRRERESILRAELEGHRREEDIIRSRMQRIQQQISEIQIESNAPARVQMASAASVPSTRSNRRQIRLSMMAIMGSFGFAFMLGFLRELTDQQVRSPRDIKRLTTQPVLAAIPHLSEDNMMKDADINFITADFPNSMLADEYRRILARFLYPEEHAAELNSLLVVSPSRGDGKTALASNIAIALEQANRRVLLVDLSSQRPEIEHLFGLEQREGLAEVLFGTSLAEDIIQGTEYERLFVIGPGSSHKRLSGQLASREMMDFLEWAEGEFDHVIFDSPPMLLMSDAKLLAPAVDGVVMVVGAGKSTLGMVQRCIRDLEQLGPNMVGIVLNGMRRFRGGYLQQNRQLFYDYNNDLKKENGRYAHKRNASEEEIPEINIIDDESDHVDEDDESVVVLLPYDEEDIPKSR